MGQYRPTSADRHYPSSNTAAVVTYTAVIGRAHMIDGLIHWSYDNLPTGGRLTIQDGSGNTILDLSITSQGPGFTPVDGLTGSDNTAMIITLAAGGSGVTGKLTVGGHQVVNIPS